MNLLQQQALLRERWQKLLAASRADGISDRVLLGTLGADLSRMLAEQAPTVSDAWVDSVRTQVEMLRSRSSLARVADAPAAEGATLLASTEVF